MRIFPPLAVRKKTPAPDDDYWYYPLGSQNPTLAGVKVDERTAAKYLTVYTCVSLISGDASRLPLQMFQRRSDGHGKDRVFQHRLYDVVHSTPNNEMTSQLWRESGFAQDLLWGNTYHLKIRNQLGRIIEIWPIDNPGGVDTEREEDPKNSRFGQLKYSWTPEGMDQQTWYRDDILHIPGFGFNGIVGMSQIAIARESVGLGLALNEFAARYFGNGTHPAGILSMPPEAQTQDIDQGQKYLDWLKGQISGLGKSHNMMLALNGEKYTPLAIPMNDAQFLESRNFQKVEIASFYHVPPDKVGVFDKNANHNNLEQQNQAYIDQCLIHWLHRWEQCLNQQLLTREERMRGLFFEFNVNGLLRGDMEARGKFYQTQWQVGAITSNEIRELENRNPKDGLDEPYVQTSYAPVSVAAELARQKQGSIANQYYPMIFDAAQAIVNRETKALTQQADKIIRNGAMNGYGLWLHDFYAGFGDYIKQKLGPPLCSYLTAIGQDPDSVKRMIDQYAERHAGASHLKLAFADAVQIKAISNEWRDTRAAQITNDLMGGRNDKSSQFQAQ